MSCGSRGPSKKHCSAVLDDAGALGCSRCWAYSSHMTGLMSLRPRGQKAKSDFRFIERPRLDINDLLAIERNMSSIGKVRVTSEQFTGEKKSVADFFTTEYRGLESIDFDVSAADYSSMHVSLDSSRAYVTGAEGNRDIARVRSQVEVLVAMRSRKVVTRAAQAAKYLFMLGFWLGVLGVFTKLNDKRSMGNAFYIASVGFTVLSGLLYVVGRVCKGEISLSPRREQLSWWRRNRDRLLVQVLGGAVLVGLGFFLGKL